MALRLFLNLHEAIAFAAPHASGLFLWSSWHRLLLDAQPDTGAGQRAGGPWEAERGSVR